ncbi:hypothetical protein HYQ44_003660 [Verticillium longisporum]|nr:hypothetical protein HYQ44_003660 [Verticillium longisporum]
MPGLFTAVQHVAQPLLDHALLFTWRPSTADLPQSHPLLRTYAATPRRDPEAVQGRIAMSQITRSNSVRARAHGEGRRTPGLL